MNDPESNKETPSEVQSSRRAFLKASSFASILAATPTVLVGLITTAGSADAATTAPATTAPPGTGTTVLMKCTAPSAAATEPTVFDYDNIRYTVALKLVSSVTASTTRFHSVSYTVGCTVDVSYQALTNGLPSGDVHSFTQLGPATFAIDATCGYNTGVITQNAVNGTGQRSSNGGGWAVPGHSPLTVVVTPQLVALATPLYTGAKSVKSRIKAKLVIDIDDQRVQSEKDIDVDLTSLPDSPPE